MRKPLLRYLAPLAIVVLCAAAPLPAATTASSGIGGLDLPVPAIAGAWSVSLRGPGLHGSRLYALDSLGTAVEGRIAFYPLDQRTVAPVRLSPTDVAAIAQRVATAKTDSWRRDVIYQDPYAKMYGLDTLDSLVPNPTTEPSLSSDSGSFTLTLAWRAPDGTIQHGQAAWNVTGPTAEPADAIALAHTVGTAFGLLI